MSRPNLSVVLTTCDRSKPLRDMLQDFNAQTLPPEQFEVLVSDDGSSTPAEQAAQDFNPRFRLLFERGPRRGPATARNRVLRRAEAPLLLFLNDDLRLEPDLLEGHLLAQSMYGGRPTAVLGAFDFPPELRKDPLHRIAEELGLIGTLRMNPGMPLDPDCFCTGNLSVPTEEVLAVGGFDEAFEEPAGEDVDLGFRLIKERGVTLVHSRKPFAWHHHHHQPADWWIRCARYGRTWRRLARKHGHPIFWPSLAAFLDPREAEAARARVLAQQGMAEELIHWVEQVGAGLAPQGEARVECLDQSFRLPEESELLLRACFSGAWAFVFQKACWEA